MKQPPPQIISVALIINQSDGSTVYMNTDATDVVVEVTRGNPTKITLDGIHEYTQATWRPVAPALEDPGTVQEGGLCGENPCRGEGYLFCGERYQHGAHEHFRGGHRFSCEGICRHGNSLAECD